MPSGGRLRLLLVAAESCSVIALRKRSLKGNFCEILWCVDFGFSFVTFPL